MGTLPVRMFRTTLLAAALLTAVPASAELFKWVDERGVVTYSNAPPTTGKQPKKIEIVPERVSVYTPDAELTRALQPDARRDARIASLERQIESARRAPASAPDPSNARQAAAYERCIADRRVDCDAIRSGASTGYGADGYPVGYYAPLHVVGALVPLQPFAILSTPTARIGVSTAPPVGISTAPPVGISTAPPVGIGTAAPVGAPARSRSVGFFR